jgi:Family of unknown function (DUF5715)
LGAPLRATYRTAVIIAVAVLLSSNAFAAHIRGPRYRRSSVRHTRQVRWTPMLRGSHDSLLRQNAEIDRLQLPRIANEGELLSLIAREQLVPITASEWLRVDSRLEPSRRFCRPWTRHFLEDLGAEYYKQFHQPIQVNSAVRTVDQQKKLRRINGNAAPAAGEVASSHLAGLTVDIGRRGMSRKQQQFVEQYLVNLRSLNLVEAAEERRQAVFHVMVSEGYTAWREARRVANR